MAPSPVPAAGANGYIRRADPCQTVLCPTMAAGSDGWKQPGRVVLNNVLVAIAVFLIAVMAALFGAPRVIDWNGYRGVIEEEATRLLGRDVRVGGRVRVRLLPTPTFSVEQVRVADTEANSGEPFFRAEQISGKLAIGPLFRGALQANEIVLIKPLLHLVFDDQGRGNWTTIGQGNGRLPFMPTDVALQSVRIEGGVLAINGADRTERIRLEAIDGEFSATALDGPYRFRGYFGVDPARRELRVSTTKPEADGSIRFKAALKHQETGANFTFDARAVDLAQGARLEGELTAQVPLPQFSSGPQPSGSASGPRTEPEAPVEVKAALSADTRLLKLSNLTLAFERQGRPQILTGEAEIDLGTVSNVRAALAAKWLDLDQLIGAGPAGTPPASEPRHGPVSGLITLATRLNGFTPDQGRADLTLDVEQANLGAEPVSGLRVVLSGRGGETDIQELRIGLPGGARADLKGLMTGSGEETAFNGDIVLRGSSLARFLGWATAGGFVLDPARDGRFAMRSKLAASPGGVLAREFVGELAGTIVQGELGYRWGARREVSMLVEGPLVDLRPLLPVGPAGERSPLLAYLTASAALNPAAKDLGAIYRVRAGQLILPNGTFNDAAVDIEVRNGRVRIEQLRLLTDTGVAIELEGDMPTAIGQPSGTIRGVVSARDAAGFATLADLLALPADVLPERSRWTGLVPLRLAGAMTFAVGRETPVGITADGDIAGAHVRFKSNLSKGLDAVRRAPLEVSATFDGANAETVLDVLLPGLGTKSAVAPPVRSASTIVIDAAGLPELGMTTLATLNGDGLKASFNGTAKSRPARAGDASDILSNLDLAGDLIVDAADGARVRRLWPAAPRMVLDGAAVAVRGRLKTSDGEMELSHISGRIAGSDIGGAVRVIETADGRRLTGAIDVARLVWAASLGPILRSDSAGRTALWPESRFDFDAIAKWEGELAITAKRLQLPGGLGLDAAGFTLVFGPGRVEFRDIEGRGGGGTWSAGVKLDRSADGTTGASVVVRLVGGQLADMLAGGGRAPVAVGPIAGLVTLSGRGVSPQDLASALTGRGSVTLSAGRISSLTPGAVAGALDDALKGPADGLVAALRRRLAEPPAPDTAITVPARTVAVTVARGVMTTQPMVLETADGRMTSTLALDLSTFDLTGNSRFDVSLQPRPTQGWATTVSPGGVPQPPADVPLPPVTVTFAAPAGDLHRARTETSSEALERELAVRKLERDTTELERLRKLDEDRTRGDAGREQTGAPLPAALPVSQGESGPAPAATAPVPPEPVPAAVAPKAVAPPAPPKPAYRPLNSDEQKRIFGGG